LPECEGDDRKRHLDEEDATLKLHYGNLAPKSCVVATGKSTEEILASLRAA
jgi:hypothetical protein